MGDPIVLTHTTLERPIHDWSTLRLMERLLRGTDGAVHRLAWTPETIVRFTLRGEECGPLHLDECADQPFDVPFDSATLQLFLACVASDDALRTMTLRPARVAKLMHCADYMGAVSLVEACAAYGARAVYDSTAGKRMTRRTLYPRTKRVKMT